MLLSDSEKEKCVGVVPELEEKASDHFVACHFPEARADVAAAEDLGVDGLPGGI
jgi:peptide/nickel transport system ATP-binding protein